MKHRIYFAGNEHGKPPQMELVVYHYNDGPEDVLESGYKFMKWLLRHASGTWIRGVRKALEDPTMGVTYDPDQEDEQDE